MSAICHQICEFGSSDTAAAAHFGIPASTLSRWKFLNPDMELRFASSREDFRNRHLHKLQTALTRDGRHDWRASAWLLERIFPEDYSRRPGRRVNPASENQTWLDQAVAADLAGDDRIHRAQFENACQQGYEAARTYIAQPFWDDYEPNAHTPLPITASFDAKNPGPASLPSYATYAEALESALRFDANANSIQFPLPTPATSLSRPSEAKAETDAEANPTRSEEPSSKITETPAPIHDRLPLHHHLHLPQETAPLTATTLAPTHDRFPLHHHLHLPQETAPLAATTPEPPEIAALAAAEGRTQASPRQASATSAALGPQPTTSRPEGTAQKDAHTHAPTSEITKTPTPETTFPTSAPSMPTPQAPAIFPVLTEFPYPAGSKFPLPNLFQNSRIPAEPALVS